jgi:hypothetical protein
MYCFMFQNAIEAIWHSIKDLLQSTATQIFQLYHGENKLIFNEMMMRSALYKTNMLSWIFIVLSLTQHSVDRHLAPLGHIIFIPSQPISYNY